MNSLLSVQVEVPASRAVLEQRLVAKSIEREFRRGRAGVPYGKCQSDQWLEADIATLHAAIAAQGGAEKS